MMRVRTDRLACLALLLFVSFLHPVHAQVGSTDDSLDLSCGPPPAGHPVKGRRDYRLMLQDERDQKDLRYHQSFHIEPARKQIRSGGNLSWDVMNNLHFVLHKVPNDPRALALLIEWDAAGGKDKRYAAPGCYFAWARQFAPGDTTVWTYGGVYFYQNKDTDRAMQWWSRAVAIDPSHPEANYNLGLLLFDMGRYDEARTRAWAAYAAGYPLPGLREKLFRVGEWQEPPPSPGE